MSRSAARARAGRDRPSLYQEITDKIITELEAGRVPWVQPWGTVRAKASLTVLSILGALAATIAGQMSPADAGSLASNPRTWVAVVGVVCLAAATFFTSRLLGTAHVTDWVRARAIAESLKREAYKFAAAAAPYDNADPAQSGQLLDQERIKIEKDGDDLLPKQVPAKGEGSTPRGPLSHDEYIARRVTSGSRSTAPKVRRQIGDAERA